VYKTRASCSPHPEEIKHCSPASQVTVPAPRICDSLGRKETEGTDRALQLALMDIQTTHYLKLDHDAAKRTTFLHQKGEWQGGGVTK